MNQTCLGLAEESQSEAAPREPTDSDWRSESAPDRLGSAIRVTEADRRSE